MAPLLQAGLTSSRLSGCGVVPLQPAAPATSPDKLDSRNRAFKRCLESLENSSLIRVIDDCIELTGQPDKTGQRRTEQLLSSAAGLATMATTQAGRDMAEQYKTEELQMALGRGLPDGEGISDGLVTEIVLLAAMDLLTESQLRRAVMLLGEALQPRTAWMGRMDDSMGTDEDYGGTERL